eukprot:scaffold153329_cov27-Tisochrysis_lutea.AAC.2
MAALPGKGAGMESPIFKHGNAMHQSIGSVIQVRAEGQSWRYSLALGMIPPAANNFITLSCSNRESNPHCKQPTSRTQP